MSIFLTINVFQKYNKCFAITIGSLPINNAQQNYRKTIGKKGRGDYNIYLLSNKNPSA